MGKWWTYLIDTILTIVITAVVGWALFYKPVTGSLSDQLAVWSAKYAALVKAQTDGLSAISGRLGDTDGTLQGIIDSIDRRSAEAKRLGNLAAASGASAREATARASAAAEELRRILEAVNGGDSESQEAALRNEEFGRRAALELGIGGS